MDPYNCTFTTEYMRQKIVFKFYPHSSWFKSTYAARSFWISFSIWKGEVVGGYLSTTFPFLSTKNFSKFHFIRSPRNPPALDLRN